MSWAAQWPGLCADCGDYFQPGELIEYRWAQGQRSEYHHVTCPGSLPPPPAGAPCPDCFLYHVGECL